MVYILWSLGGVIWVAGNGNIPIGMMYVAVGTMFARDATKKQKLIGLALSATAVVIALLRLIGIWFF